MDKDTAISVEHVSKKYCKSLKRSMVYGLMDIGRNMLGMSSRSERLRKGEFWALNDISFEVKKGETLGIIGPNGSGKTTLLKLLNGIFWPDKGKITIKGKVGALIELGAGFHPMLTGRENIYINAAILGMTKKEVDKKFDEIVEFADIGDFIDTPVKFYSSGMHLRLAFAVVIHSEPDIFLIDEILAVGDAPFQMKCFGKIRGLIKDKKTVIIATHDMSIIQRYTNKVCILYNGKMQGIELPKDAINQYLALISNLPHKDIEQEAIKIERNKRIISYPKISDDTLMKLMPLDKCPKKSNYNRNEFRYGNGSASIIDFEILNESREEIFCIKSKEIFFVRCRVIFKEDVKRPIFGISFKNKEGLELYGTNSLLKKMEIKEQAKGDDIWIEYKLKANLQAGEYFISVGVAAFEEERIIPLDRRYDLAIVSVLPTDESFGLVNLEGEIRITN